MNEKSTYTYQFYDKSIIIDYVHSFIKNTITIVIKLSYKKSLHIVPVQWIDFFVFNGRSYKNNLKSPTNLNKRVTKIK